MDEIQIQKSFFHPVCNKEEIERIFNVTNAQDFLLKIRAETIVDHMRLFRVYRNKAIIDENNWSLALCAKGRVSALEAKLKAEQEYETYRKRQDREYVSDFDREIKRIQGAQEGDNEENLRNRS